MTQKKSFSEMFWKMMFKREFIRFPEQFPDFEKEPENESQLS